MNPALVRSRLVASIDGAGRARRAELRQRIATVIETLGGGPAARSTGARLDQLADLLTRGGQPEMWLALAVIGAHFPVEAQVLRAMRRARLDGPLASLFPFVAPWVRLGPRRVRVVVDATLVDVHVTARTHLSTGIQRVTREAVKRWVRDHDVTLVDWTPELDAMSELAADRRDNALDGGRAVGAEREPDEVLVPWRCRYLLPELLTEPHRAAALLAMFRYGHNDGAAIGYDCVPLSTAETILPGMGSNFAWNLGALAHTSRIATISIGSKAEYDGWRAMLAGAGIPGPQIAEVVLPAVAPEPRPLDDAETRDLLVIADLPMVFCAGSHEPRKNHLAVLHAAEVLWREGRRFSLLFAGGNSWGSDEVRSRIADLSASGRPVQSLANLDDSQFGSAYRLARFTVFPSLNEGFGLPVAESLDAGTPVVTSNFGSMAELAADGGALLVDPRDDASIVDAMRRLLTDDALLETLRAEARARPTRTWDDYAAEVWDYLVEGREPSPSVA